MADPRDKFKTILTQMDRALRGKEDQALADQVKIVLGIKSKEEHPLYQFMTLKRKYDGSQRGQKLDKKDMNLILQLEKIGKQYFEQKERIEKNIRKGEELAKQDTLRAKAEAETKAAAKPKETPVAAQPQRVRPTPPPKPKPKEVADQPQRVKPTPPPKPKPKEMEPARTQQKSDDSVKTKKSDITEQELSEIDDAFTKMQTALKEKEEPTPETNKHFEALRAVHNSVVLHMRGQVQHSNREKLIALASQPTTDKETKHFIHFLVACDDYRKQPSKEKWKAIYDQFLSKDAKESLNFARLGMGAARFQLQQLAAELTPSSSQGKIATALFHEDATKVLSEKKNTLPRRPLPTPPATPTHTKEEPSSEPGPGPKPPSTFRRSSH